MKFDIATAALIFALAGLAFSSHLYLIEEDNQKRLDRYEKVLRGYCVGDPKVEICATLDLPYGKR